MYYAIISTEINQKAAIGADGSAFYDAREIINFLDLIGGPNHEQSIRRNENQKKYSQIQTGHDSAGHP